ncbi:MAG: ribonuclease P protein component [Candidatus Gastranaerophilaceae bacterium]
MLQKKYRLKKETAFSATFKLKNCKSNAFVTIYKGKAKTDSSIPTKIGIIVSKKIHKRAVKRNKIKRRLREIYIEAAKKGLPENLQQALSIIFIANAKSLDADFITLKQAAIELLNSF